MEFTKSNRRKSAAGIELVNVGKVPPQDRKIEAEVLGTMVYNNTIIGDVQNILKPQDFYVDAHVRICQVIYDLYSENIIPDLVNIISELTRKDELELIGGAYFLSQLTSGNPGMANLNYSTRKIKEGSLKRKLIVIAGNIFSNSYENGTDVFDLMDEVNRELQEISFEVNETRITKITTVAMSVVKNFHNKVYNAKNNIKDPNSIRTGIPEWDNINGDLFPGVYIVAGRPGMGKGVHLTELACRMGAENNIGIINGEMTNEQLLTRIGCNLLNFGNELYKKDKSQVTDLELRQVEEAMEAAIQLKLHIHDGKDIGKIIPMIKLWVAKYEVKAILADFLTIFELPKDLERVYRTETDKVNYILKQFVNLAKAIGIPIILYVQMNREIIGRTIKEPNLADLKQSGSIEELAFQVSFLHRPEYYDKDVIVDDMGESIRGLCYQIIGKHRDGPLARLKFNMDLPKSKITSWEQDNYFSEDNIMKVVF